MSRFTDKPVGIVIGKMEVTKDEVKKANKIIADMRKKKKEK